MKRLIINLLALIALLSVGVMHLSAVTYAQDEPPTLVDPFATEPEPEPEPEPVVEAADDSPPALTLPAAEEPEEEAVVEEEVVEEEAPAEEAPAEEPVHAAAPVENAYSGGTTAESGPGLAIVGLGSLLGAAALRRRKK